MPGAVPGESGTIVFPPASATQDADATEARAVLRFGTGEAVLVQAGRELRVVVPGADLLALLQVTLAVHAQIPAASWPGNDVPHAVKAPGTLLDPRADPADAAVRIVEGGLHHMLANARPALAGHMEGIHQMRVAVRRLRTALALFAPLFPPAIALETDLRGLGRLLGAARDWDVFCRETLPAVGDGALPAPDLLELGEVAETRRRAAHDRMVQELDDAAILALVQGVAGWTATASGGPRLKRRLADVAPDLLSRLERKVQNRGRHLSRRSEEELHALRRASKQLRYGIEHLRPLFKRRPVKHYLASCGTLTDSLGELNDLVNAGAHALVLADGEPDLAAAAHALADVFNRRKQEAAARVADGWRRFGAADPFWR